MTTTSPYPGALPNYGDHDETDNTEDIIYAQHVNQLRADVKAIAATVGVNPSPGNTVGAYLNAIIAGDFVEGAQVFTTLNLASTLAHTIVQWPSPQFNYPTSIASVSGNLFIPETGIWRITANVHYFNQATVGGGLAQIQSISGGNALRLAGSGPLPFITDGSHDNPQCHSVVWEGYITSGSRFWLEVAQTSGLTVTTFAQLTLGKVRQV